MKLIYFAQRARQKSNKSYSIS